MKAFTSLEQSKKLAKILPLDSADMGYIPSAEDDDGNTLYTAEFKSEIIFDEDCIPCWSLSALLDVIPKKVEIKGQGYAPCLFPLSNGYWIYKLWYNSNEIIHSPCGVYCDNLIDACYEMIFQLKLYKPNIKWQGKK